jgi:hypothetical protein
MNNTIVLACVHPKPVLERGSSGTEGNLHGFEGGCCIKLGSTYHLFATEMAGEPAGAHTLLAHWASNNRLDWHRVSTLYKSSENYDGHDPRAALWSPMPIFNESENRWNFFYVAYRAAPNTPTEWLTNFDGRIWRVWPSSPYFSPPMVLKKKTMGHLDWPKFDFKNELFC